MIRDDDETHEEYLEKTCDKPIELANCVTFENANDFVYHLVNSNPIAAKAVKNELEYWNDKLGTL